MTLYDLSTLTIIAVATWRLALMLMYEDGPFRALQRIRTWTGIEHDATGYPVGVPDGNVFGCLGCMSVWCGAAMMGAWLLFPPVVVLLAVAGGALMIERVTSRGNV